MNRMSLGKNSAWWQMELRRSIFSSYLQHDGYPYQQEDDARDHLMIVLTNIVIQLMLSIFKRDYNATCDKLYR